MFSPRVTLAIASLAGYGLAEALQKAHALGFQAVTLFPGGPRTEHSLGPFPTLDYYGAGEEHKLAVKAALEPFRYVSLHQAWDREWRAWIDCARWVGAKLVTVHPGVRKPDETVGEYCDRTSERIRQIADYADEAGVRIGVENEGGARDDYVRLIEAVTRPAAGATIDIGHCGYFQEVRAVADLDERAALLNDTIAALVRDLGARIISLHAHDVRKSDWRDHRTVGSGVIDFEWLFAELEGVGFGGTFEIELEEPDMERAAALSGKRLSALAARPSSSARAGR